MSDDADYLLTLAGALKLYSLYGSAGYITTGYDEGLFSKATGASDVRWTFAPVDGKENTYTLSITTAITEGDSPIRNRNKWYLSCNGDYASATIDATDPTIEWMLVNEEEVEQSKSDYARYRMQNGLTAYESGMPVNPSEWITGGYLGYSNGDNKWYMDGNSMVKWGQGEYNYAYKRFVNMPSGKYTLTMLVNSVTGQQLFFSGAAIDGSADYAAEATPNVREGEYLTLSFEAAEDIPVLCFGIRDHNPAAYTNYWCVFTDVILNYEGAAASGITTINDSRTSVNSCYDLQGRYINPDRIRPGLYIVNGRKKMVK